MFDMEMSAASSSPVLTLLTKVIPLIIHIYPTMLDLYGTAENVCDKNTEVSSHRETEEKKTTEEEKKQY